MHTNRTLAVAALLSLTAGGVAGATSCSADNTASSTAGFTSSGTSTGGSGSGASGSGTSTGVGGGFGFDAGNNDGALTLDSACAAQSAEATLEVKPVDIIIIIDNSGSMTLEIEGIQTNINQNFANIIQSSGLDYRVILLAKHGSAASAQSVCIEAPLSGIPAGGCAPPPAQPINNPPFFYHYSREIASRDSWCRLVSTFDGTQPDDFGFAPNGWSEWLRPDSFKTFIEITDDGVGCGAYSDGNTVAGGTTAAAAFDAALLALSPMHFGDMTNRNYRWYSIVAMAYNTPPDKPYEPTDPILTAECPTAANPGTGHQALSILTGGLRFPTCDTTSYGPLFQAIAQGVISGAKVACEFPVPAAPMGQTIDLSSVVVEYLPGNMGAPLHLTQVADAASCAPDSFYIANNVIYLCPDTCTLVQGDKTAKINVLFACEPGGAN